MRKGLPYFESSAPLRTIFDWWLSGRGLHLTHAAAVGTPDGGCLIGGRSGSGKSTTARACMGTELAYAGDDFVLVGAEPEPYVYNLYNTAKLDPDNLHRFPHLAPYIGNAERLRSEKAYLYLSAKIATGFPLRAILVPRIGNGPNTRIGGLFESRRPQYRLPTARIRKRLVDHAQKAAGTNTMLCPGTRY